MRVGLITICIIPLLAAPGCTKIFGKFRSVDECAPGHTPSADALEKAPVWVPGSPMRANMPPEGCIGGDGSHHLDRLCVVAEVHGMTSITQSENVAEQKSLRLLGDALESKIDHVLGPSADPDAIDVFSKQLRDAIGRVTGTWRSPDCTTYAIAEVKRTDFTFVVHGPELSDTARALLLDKAAEVVGTP